MARAACWMGRVHSLPPDEQSSFPEPPPVKHEMKKPGEGEFCGPKQVLRKSTCEHGFRVQTLGKGA